MVDTVEGASLLLLNYKFLLTLGSLKWTSDMAAQCEASPILESMRPGTAEPDDRGSLVLTPIAVTPATLCSREKPSNFLLSSKRIKSIRPFLLTPFPPSSLALTLHVRNGGCRDTASG